MKLFVIASWVLLITGCGGTPESQGCAQDGACRDGGMDVSSTSSGSAGQPCGAQRACDDGLACAFEGSDTGICKLCGDQDAPCCAGGGPKCERSNMACFDNPGRNQFCSICGVKDELCCPDGSGLAKCAAGLECQLDQLGAFLCRAP